MGYTLQQKIDICLMAEQHPKWKQKDLAKWCQQTYHTVKKPSQTTISRILARKDQLISMKENQFKFVRKRKLTNPLLRKILQEWICQSAWNGIPITPPIIQDTAASVWQKIPNEFRDGNGSFSYKWCSLFLSKLNLNIGHLDKELVRPGKIWTFEERHLLKTILCRIPPKDLFTLDETFLAYNLPLDMSYYEISKIKRKIDILDIMLCCNADGSEKLDPLIIGRYQNYQCFLDEFPNLYKNNPSNHNNINNNNNNSTINSGVNGLSGGYHNHNSNSAGNTKNGGSTSVEGSLNNPFNAPDDLYTKVSAKYGIAYQSNRESFLTSTIFHEWLIQWDKKLASSKDNRKIYIILDDCCSHRIVNVKLTNITLIFTRAQSKFLPFNWGVLDEFKTRYRVQQYEALINLQNMLSTNNSSNNINLATDPTGVQGSSPQSKVILSNEQSRINICNAFKLIKRSWQSISADSIKSNWKSSGILPHDYIQLKETVSMGLRKNEFHAQLLNDLSKKLIVWKSWDHDILLDLNLENISASFLSLQEIITAAIVDYWEPITRVIDLEEFDGDELEIGALDQELNEIINGVSPTINTGINFNGIHAGVTDVNKSGDLTVKNLIDDSELSLFSVNANQTNTNNTNILSLIPGFDDANVFLSNNYFKGNGSASPPPSTVLPHAQSNSLGGLPSAKNEDIQDEVENEESEDDEDEDDEDEDEEDDVYSMPATKRMKTAKGAPSAPSVINSTQDKHVDNGLFNTAPDSFDMILNTSPSFNNQSSNLATNTNQLGGLSLMNTDFENKYLRQQLGGLGGSQSINDKSTQPLVNKSLQMEGLISPQNTIMRQSTSSHSNSFASPGPNHMIANYPGQEFPITTPPVQLTSVQETYEMNKKLANMLVTLLKYSEFGDIDLSKSTEEELRALYKTSVANVRKNKETFMKYEAERQHIQSPQNIHSHQLGQQLSQQLPQQINQFQHVQKMNDVGQFGNSVAAQQPSQFPPHSSTLLANQDFFGVHRNMHPETVRSTPNQQNGSPNMSLPSNHTT